MKQGIPLLVHVAVIVCYLSLTTPTSDATATEVCPLISRDDTCSVPCSDTTAATPCSPTQFCCSRCCREPVTGCLAVDNIIRYPGTEFPAEDGCNTCVCERNGTIACTDNACTTSPGGVCMVNGVEIEIGDSFPAEDGCNTCICSQGGTASCTEIFCPPSTPPPPVSPQGCPRFEPIRDTIGACVLECGPDVQNGDCDEGLLCCTNGCGGTSCVRPVTVCEGRNGVQYQVGDSIVSEDGCNTCSCGRSGVLTCTEQTCPTVTGCPRSASGTPETCLDATNNVCSDDAPCSDDQRCCTGADGCSVCVNPVCNGNDGNEYPVGETFRTRDGCNQCACLASGRVSCTTRLCVDRCYLRPVPSGDNCTTPATRYFYEPSASNCLSFEEGCGNAEQNNFASLRQCYDNCNPRSVCNADIYPPNFIALCDVVTNRWTFNTTTDECMEIKYRPCEETSIGYNVFDSVDICRRTCTRSSTPECSNDNVPVTCSANPCDVSTCPNFPNARCVTNFCEGCNAQYFDREGNDVTNRCETRETCPDGSPVVRCFVDPCDVATCPQFPNARCVSNYCGGCNHNFLNGDEDVTTQCNRALPVALTKAVCPLLNQSMGGNCVESCSSDINCTDRELCCSNGCGRACMTPTLIPFYNIPPVCPETDIRDLFRSCDITEESCSMRSDCDDDELCCRDRCGRRCKDTITSSTPCFDVVNQIIVPLSGSNVMYTPSCDSDGTFSPIQCDATRLCWCVDVRNGRPVSSYSPRGTRPQCSESTGCRYNGMNYSIGSSFPSEDGCNKCSCGDGGVVSCTRRACIDPCSLPPEAGPCRASIQAFYYDQDEEKCVPFTYGGCGGNDNKFESVKDCLLRCDPDNDCLQAPEPCDIEDRSFIFNKISGQCERYNLGGCDRRDNVFSTGQECFDECSPRVIPVDRCLDVRCDTSPSCPRGSEIVQDDRHCCPYCGPIVRCDDDEYRCADGTCIPEERLCDQLRDCSDGADEEQCEEVCEFTCGDRTCIRRSRVCDGILDCNDGADVKNCTEGFSNVYYLTERDIPVHCPASSDSLGACVIQCDSDDNCTSGTICCRNGCGQTCVTGNRFQILCPSILRQSMQSDRLGMFRPECQDDGTFSPVQCHGSTGYCWCVDIDSGQPISEGVRDERPVCGSCTRRDGEEVAVGESYRSEDGCNTCICTGGNNVVCTKRACDDAPCQFLDRMVPSNTTFDDECNTCYCFAGSLRCSRKPCIRAAVAEAVKQLITARLPFEGIFSEIEDKLEDFRREVTRLFLDMYGTTLGVTQDQIQKIDVIEGSVIVIVTLAESNSTTTGANLTVWVGQVEQDFEEGILIIRYEDQILTPSGEFQTDQDPSSTLLTWHIVVIVVAVVIVLTVILASLIIIVVLTLKKKRSGSENKTDGRNEPNEYELPSKSGFQEKKELY